MKRWRRDAVFGLKLLEVHHGGMYLVRELRLPERERAGRVIAEVEEIEIVATYHVVPHQRIEFAMDSVDSRLARQIVVASKLSGLIPPKWL